LTAAFDSNTLNTCWIAGTRQAFQEHHVDDSHGFLPFAGGGGLGIHRSRFLAVGGFDEHWWGAGEDVDFCWRVQQAGAPLHFVPDARVSIRWRATFGSLYRQGRSYGRGEPFLYRKYRGEGMEPAGWRQGVNDWKTLVRRAPKLRTRAQVGNWVRRAGRKVGRVEGSVRARVTYL
jgi:hypothetical protein